MDEMTLERAVRLAIKVHKGQKDRAGSPVILHVLRVMAAGRDLEEQVLGALHDVLERSELTLGDVQEKGFPPEVIEALDHITRRKEEDYEGYIRRVGRNELARRVKRHDLRDKLDLSRQAALDPADLKCYNRQLAACHALGGEKDGGHWGG